MATTQDAYTTGAAQEDYLRRRQVPRQDSSNGSLKRSYNETDDKKTRKVNMTFISSNINGLMVWLIGYCALAADLDFDSTNIGSMGISPSSFGFYPCIILHTDVQNRSVTNSDLG